MKELYVAMTHGSKSLTIITNKGSLPEFAYIRLWSAAADQTPSLLDRYQYKAEARTRAQSALRRAPDIIGQRIIFPI